MAKVNGTWKVFCISKIDLVVEDIHVSCKLQYIQWDNDFEIKPTYLPNCKKKEYTEACYLRKPCGIPNTIDWEIFVIKIFCQSTSTTKNEQAKCFLGKINGVNLFCRVVIAMKIKPDKSLASEVFFQQNSQSMVLCLIILYICKDVAICAMMHWW